MVFDLFISIAFFSFQASFEGVEPPLGRKKGKTKFV